MTAAAAWPSVAIAWFAGTVAAIAGGERCVRVKGIFLGPHVQCEPTALAIVIKVAATVVIFLLAMGLFWRLVRRLRAVARYWLKWSLAATYLPLLAALAGLFGSLSLGSR